MGGGCCGPAAAMAGGGRQRGDRTGAAVHGAGREVNSGARAMGVGCLCTLQAPRGTAGGRVNSGAIPQGSGESVGCLGTLARDTWRAP